jgi:hypothetical protein
MKKLNKQLVEIDDEIKEEMTKNQIARLFTIRVCKHFTSAVEMDKEDFFKYLQEANNEMKVYIENEMKKENENENKNRNRK